MQFMNVPADLAFSDIFQVLYTGRDSSDRVLQTIIEGLLDGRYQPGQRVIAAQLAEELDVSIVPVREAIHILVGDGVLEMTAGRSPLIADMDKQEVLTTWRIVSALAKLGVGFAARHINDSEEHTEKLNDAMAMIRESAGKVDDFQFLMILLSYHMVIHDIARMSKLDEAVRRMGFFFWSIFFPKYIPMAQYSDAYIRNHQRVTDAIINGDPLAAEGAYQYHIEWTNALIAGERPDPNAVWVYQPLKPED